MSDKKILVLGAGLVAKPLVQYLLDQPNFYVTVATRTISKAEDLVSRHPRGNTCAVDITASDTTLKELISNSDLVISLLPYTHHLLVAKFCIEYGKDMITTSYVSQAMQSLDELAKDADILILNEIGLDPGIDHMSAMKIIDKVHKNSGKVISFKSYCGGLPAPEANTNPLGYKFSWSPRGVVLAAKNSARYLENGKEIFIPQGEIFRNCRIVEVEGLGKFEAYPNRDSLSYTEKYNVPEVKTMLRATLRNIGWCELWDKIFELGLLDEVTRNLQGVTFKQFIAQLIKGESKNLKKQLASYLKTAENSEIIKKLEWLGMLSDELIPLQQGSAL
ncbi:MAG: saccharopine dehydrogenase C-terminal domain-containing protein, partial [Candidatus Thermoplasmatota archaeon]